MLLELKTSPEEWEDQTDARVRPYAHAALEAAGRLLREQPLPSDATADANASSPMLLVPLVADLEALNHSLGMLLSARGWRATALPGSPPERALAALRRYASAAVALAPARMLREQQQPAVVVGRGWTDALVDGAALRLELLRIGPGGKTNCAQGPATPAERRLDDALRAAVQRAVLRNGGGGGSAGSPRLELRTSSDDEDDEVEFTTATRPLATTVGTPAATPRQRELYLLVSSAAMVVDPGPGATGKGAERLPARLAARRAWNGKAARWLGEGAAGAI
jgi:hypothetical protein